MYDKNLDTFLAVCECGSMSKAAESLFVTQPVVSRKIGQLERDLGASLFERTPQGVTLTAEGRILEETALILRKESERARQRIYAASQGAQAVVRVNGSIYMPWPRYSHARILYKQRYPEYEIMPIYSDQGTPQWDTFKDALLANRLDIALCVLDKSLEHPELSVIELELDQRFCVLPPGHPLEHHAELHPEDLLGHAISLPAEGTNESFVFLMRLAEERGLSKTITRNWTPTQEWGASDEIHLVLGALLPSLPSLVAIPYLDGLPPTAIGAVFRKDANEATTAFAECLQEVSSNAKTEASAN